MRLLRPLLHCIIFGSVLIATIVLLKHPKNEKQGIFKVSFGTGLSVRQLPGPLQDIPSQATKVVNDAGDIASHAPIAVSEATRVAGEAVEKVHTAVGAVESLVSQFIPKGCKFGTVYACVDYGDDTKCTPYLKDGQGPWNELDDLFGNGGTSEGLSKKIASLQSKIGTLENLSKEVTSLQVFAIPGIIFAAVALLFSKATPIWFRCKVVVAMVSNMIAVAMFAVLVGIVATIYGVGKGLEEVTKGKMEDGSVFPISICILLLSLAQTGMIIVEMLACC